MIFSLLSEILWLAKSSRSVARQMIQVNVFDRFRSNSQSAILIVAIYFYIPFQRHYYNL